MEFEASIVGLPRSRTYWFSRLLTHGDLHCFHDFHSYVYEVPQGVRLLNSSCSPWNKQTGRLVIIHRDRDEAEASFKRFNNGVLPDDQIERVFDLGEKVLSSWQGLHVDYNQINDRIYEIIRFMGLSLPSTWVDMMLTMNLQSPDHGSIVDQAGYNWRYKHAQRSLDL